MSVALAASEAGAFPPDLFERAMDLLVPSGGRIGVFAYVEGEGWTRAYKFQRNVRGAIAAHLAGGMTGRSQKVPLVSVKRPIAAFGLLPWDARAVTRYLDIDLDGGVEPATVHAYLVELFGSKVITPTTGSGAAGKLRMLVHVAPIAIARMHWIVERMLARGGFKVANGSVEIFPAAKRNSRLPGGATVVSHVSMTGLPGIFTGPGLRAREHVTSAELIERVLAAPVVDLEAIARALELDDAETSAVVPVPQGDASEPTKGPTLAKTRGRVMSSLEVQRLWRDGAEPGQRDEAVFAVLYNVRRRGGGYEEIVRGGQEFIYGRNGLARTNGLRQRGMVHELRDVARRAKYVVRYSPPGRPAPVHLSRVELARLAALVLEHVPGVGQSSAGTMLYRVLPHFKGAALAGLDAPRMHSDEWRAAGGGSYAALRRLFGDLFEPRPHEGKLYRPERIWKDLAHAMHWVCSFVFDAEPTRPARAVVSLREKTGGNRSPRDIWTSMLVATDRIRRTSHATAGSREALSAAPCGFRRGAAGGAQDLSGRKDRPELSASPEPAVRSDRPAQIASRRPWPAGTAANDTGPQLRLVPRLELEPDERDGPRDRGPPPD